MSDILKRAFAQSGLTANHVAEMIGVSRQSLWLYLRSAKKLPNDRLNRFKNVVLPALREKSESRFMESAALTQIANELEEYVP